MSDIKKNPKIHIHMRDGHHYFINLIEQTCISPSDPSFFFQECKTKVAAGILNSPLVCAFFYRIKLRNWMHSDLYRKTKMIEFYANLLQWFPICVWKCHEQLDAQETSHIMWKKYDWVFQMKKNNRGVTIIKKKVSPTATKPTRERNHEIGILQLQILRFMSVRMRGEEMKMCTNEWEKELGILVFDKF